MKLLFDANISWRIIQLIEADFPNCFHVKDIPVTQPATDAAIWNFAKEKNFTIVTHDDDFEKLLLQKRIPPKVIILKSFNQNTKQIVTTLLAKKDIIDSFINNEELMILEIY